MAAVLLLACLAAAWYFLGWPGSPLQKNSAVPSTAYQTTRAAISTLRITTTGSGTLVASQSSDLSFPIKGTVGELDVKLGDHVAAGAVLAKLANSADLQASVASAQLTYLQAQQALDSLQKNAPSSLAAAYKTYTSAKEAYDSALLAQQRSGGTRCSSEVVAKYYSILQKAKQKLEDLNQCCYAGDDWVTAKEALDTAQADYDYCSTYTDTEKQQAQAALDVAKGDLATAESDYNSLKASSGVDPQALSQAELKVTNAKTSLDNANANLAGATLTAPFAGVITYVAANQGASVGTSKFITIAENEKPTVQVQVDETSMSKLVVNVAAEVTFDAIPGKTYTGKVVQVEGQLVTSGNIKTARGLVQLDSTYSKEFSTIPLGLNATVTLITQEAKNAITIPVGALRTIGTNEYGVFVQGTDGKLRFKTVTIGLKTTTSVQILTGISQNDVVSTGVASSTK